MGDQLSQQDIDALLAGSGKQPANQKANPASAPAPKPSEQSASPAPPPASTPEDIAVAQPLSLSQLGEATSESNANNIGLILDVPVEITVELGRKNMLIKDVLDVGPGAIVELNRLAGEPVDLLVNNKLLARGEVVVVNENFGIRIIDIIGPEQRIKNLR